MKPEHNKQEKLDWDDQLFMRLIEKTALQLSNHIKQAKSNQRAVSDLVPMDEIQQALEAEILIKTGALAQNGFEEFLTHYLAHSTQLHHPNYMAHQVASPAIPSALADLIHGSINNPGAIYEMGSTAASLEHVVLNWMLNKLDWLPEPLIETTQPHGAGVLMNGGSIANLVSLLAARSNSAPDAWEKVNPRNLKKMAPANSHYSVERALSIMGLGSQSLVHVAVDKNEKIIPDALAEAIIQTQASGNQIMAVVANACSTGSGLFDPLDQVAKLCKQHQLWFHVDACHAGSFLLSNKLRPLLKGAEAADSFVWDAHKMMRVSGLCTAVLVKNSKHLQNAFKQQASYLFYGSPGLGKDYLHRTIECTKTALGTKLFLTLAWQGEQAIAEYVENRVAVAAAAYKIISARPHFKCPYQPESNIFCFRYKEGDDLQIEIRETLLNEGIFHLTSTVLNGERFLRITVMTTATSTQTIHELVKVIESRW
ncbi:MAG: pyridoxal phosphate-dependent decarboxylase family protein [Marinicella sp.]